MSIKSSLNKVSNIRVLLLNFLIFLIIITKRECWPVFKQDPTKSNCLTDGYRGETILEKKGRDYFGKKRERLF